LPLGYAIVGHAYAYHHAAKNDSRFNIAMTLAASEPWAPEANVDWYGEILPSLPPSPPLP